MFAENFWSRSWVRNWIRNLKVVNTSNIDIEDSLIGLNNCTEIAKKIVQKKLSVRQSEILARQFRDKKFKLISKKDSNILELQKSLEEKTGLNVSINNKKNNTGNITFEYKNLDQLDKLIETIRKNY